MGNWWARHALDDPVMRNKPVGSRDCWSETLAHRTHVFFKDTAHTQFAKAYEARPDLWYCVRSDLLLSTGQGHFSIMLHEYSPGDQLRVGLMPVRSVEHSTGDGLEVGGLELGVALGSDGEVYYDGTVQAPPLGQHGLAHSMMQRFKKGIYVHVLFDFDRSTVSFTIEKLVREVNVVFTQLSYRAAVSFCSPNKYLQIGMENCIRDNTDARQFHSPPAQPNSPAPQPVYAAIVEPPPHFYTTPPVQCWGLLNNELDRITARQRLQQGQNAPPPQPAAAAAAAPISRSRVAILGLPGRGKSKYLNTLLECKENSQFTDALSPRAISRPAGLGAVTTSVTEWQYGAEVTLVDMWGLRATAGANQLTDLAALPDMLRGHYGSTASMTDVPTAGHRLWVAAPSPDQQVHAVVIVVNVDDVKSPDPLLLGLVNAVAAAQRHLIIAVTHMDTLDARLTTSPILAYESRGLARVVDEAHHSLNVDRDCVFPIMPYVDRRQREMRCEITAMYSMERAVRAARTFRGIP